MRCYQQLRRRLSKTLYLLLDRLQKIEQIVTDKILQAEEFFDANDYGSDKVATELGSFASMKRNIEK